MPNPSQVRPLIESRRLVVGIRYLLASESIYKGLKRQQGVNDFHFLITLRSFIEYTRRGIWYTVWASEGALDRADEVTWSWPGSPRLEVVDAMINEALGRGKGSEFTKKLRGNNEPFLNCLHALTHGNPLAIELFKYGVEKVFNTKQILATAERDVNMFRIIVLRRFLGNDMDVIWKLLSPIHDRPRALRASARSAVRLVMQSGQISHALASLDYLRAKP